MNIGKTMKGASPLGAMIFAISIILIAAFGMVGWIGNYQTANGEPLNPLLANTINAIYTNQAGPGGSIFGTGLGTNSIAGQVINNANSTKGIIGSISAAASAAGSAFSFLGVIGNFLNPFNPGNFMNVFVVEPLVIIGVPAQYAAFIAYSMVTAFLVILVLSALLIFNLL